MSAEEVYILKEQNSSEINRFRPISLLNVEENILSSVMAYRFKNILPKMGTEIHRYRKEASSEFLDA